MIDGSKVKVRGLTVGVILETAWDLFRLAVTLF